MMQETGSLSSSGTQFAGPTYKLLSDQTLEHAKGEHKATESITEQAEKWKKSHLVAKLYAPPRRPALTLI
jgi:hypothetical protein